MSTTTATFLRDYSTALTLKLVSVGGTGTPNAAGYACTNTNGLQSVSITEALVGEFYGYAYDSLGDIAYQGYVVLADDTGTYRIDDSLSVITAATQATAAALDASKIPRLTDAIAAGAAVRRNKVAATSATLDETLEATP